MSGAGGGGVNQAGTSGNPGPTGGGGGAGGGGGGPSSSSGPPSAFSFEPASIFDWASTHHSAAAAQSQQQQQQASRGNNSPYYHNPAQQQQQQPAHTLDLVTALAGGGGGGPSSIHPSATRQQQNGAGNIAILSQGSNTGSNNNNVRLPQQQHQPQHSNSNNRNNDDDDDDDDEEDDDDEGDDRRNHNNTSIQRNDTSNQQGKVPIVRKRAPGSGPTQRMNRKGGGRPKDFIWAYFDERVTPSPTPENPGGMRHAAMCKACGWTCEQPKAFRMRQHIVASCENLPDAERQRVQSIQSQKDAAAEERKMSKRSNSQGDEDSIVDDSILMGLGRKDPLHDNDGNDDIHATFGDVFSRLSASHPGSNPAEPSYFSYSSLGGVGGSGGEVMGSSGALPGSGPTGGNKQIINGTYSTSSDTLPSKKKRKKEESSGAGSSWNLSSFLNLAPSKMGKSPITCHVLDSSAGRPGANIKIRMDQLSQTGFMHVATGETDMDGRNNSLLATTMKIEKNSIFKMTFYTREYFNSKGVDSFYPFVEVVFEVKEPSEHHHIALLLSPFSYTTYRGS